MCLLRLVFAAQRSIINSSDKQRNYSARMSSRWQKPFFEMEIVNAIYE
jgi:hypothetical protein